MCDIIHTDTHIHVCAHATRACILIYLSRLPLFLVQRIFSLLLVYKFNTKYIKDNKK